MEHCLQGSRLDTLFIQPRLTCLQCAGLVYINYQSRKSPKHIVQANGIVSAFHLRFPLPRFVKLTTQMSHHSGLTAGFSTDLALVPTNGCAQFCCKLRCKGIGYLEQMFLTPLFLLTSSGIRGLYFVLYNPHECLRVLTQAQDLGISWPTFTSVTNDNVTLRQSHKQFKTFTVISPIRTLPHYFCARVWHE